LTKDSTDYLWYSTTVSGSRQKPEEVTPSFQSGEAGGLVMYVYMFINDQLAATTLGAAGEPFIVADRTAAAGKRVYRRGTNEFVETTSSTVDMSTFVLNSFLKEGGDVAASVQISLNVTLPAGSDTNLDIISVSISIKNYGP
jgi:hypothetical protein